MSDSTDIVILIGEHEDGTKMRPSDWHWRICGLCLTWDKFHNFKYSNHLHPIIINNRNGVCVHCELKKTNPEIYNHILWFAKLNSLKMITRKR